VTIDADRDTHLRVRALTSRIGAELSGVDLADLNETNVAGIRRALLAHRVVISRGQGDRVRPSRSPSPHASAR
jgi:alpha-ketoglutarate-dependent taurine dioxygenase